MLAAESSWSFADESNHEQIEEYERQNEREEIDVDLFIAVNVLIQFEVDLFTAHFNNFAAIRDALFRCDLHVFIHIFFAFFIIVRCVHMGAPFHDLMI